MLKTFEPISDKEEIKKTVQLMRKFKCGAENSDLFDSFAFEIHNIMKKHYNSKRKDFRKVLKKTIKDLRKINAKTSN